MPNARSISYIGATDLGNGFFAYRPLPSKPWRFISSADLDVAAAHLDLDRDAGHEIWPSTLQHSVEAPEWWSPAKPYMVTGGDGNIETYASLDAAESDMSSSRVWTVDPKTGEEVRA